MWLKILKGGLIAGSFALNVLNHSFFGIKTLEYNLQMHEIEKNNGVGVGLVGPLPQGHQLENNQVIQKCFYI